MNLVKALFLGRYSLIFLMSHWILFGVGIYLRGGPLRLFAHFRYEPVLLQVLTTLDLPAIFIGDAISGPSPQGLSNSQTFVYVALISVQWILLGYVVSRIANALGNAFHQGRSTP